MTGMTGMTGKYLLANVDALEQRMPAHDSVEIGEYCLSAMSPPNKEFYFTRHGE